MGMDYCWSGCASYPRFNKELEAVANIFGGYKSSITNGPCFILPKNINPILARWLQEPYGDYTSEKTKIIWDIVQQHPEIEEVSDQIWNELKICCELNVAWYIY